MAHIPDGVLSAPVLIGGAVIGATALILALRRLDEASIPKTAILAAMFFTLSLVAVPVGPSSVHLLLSGLMGLVLGAQILPAVLVGLLLQAVLFGFGGLTTLGVNLCNIALPGLLAGMLLGPGIARATPAVAGIMAGLAAAACVAATGAGVAAALVLSAGEYLPSARVILVTYLPLMAVEAAITASAVMFVKRVRPETLPGGLTVATR